MIGTLSKRNVMTNHIPIKCLDEIKDTEQLARNYYGLGGYFKGFWEPNKSIEWHDRRGINRPFLITWINKGSKR